MPTLARGRDMHSNGLSARTSTDAVMYETMLYWETIDPDELDLEYAVTGRASGAQLTRCLLANAESRRRPGEPSSCASRSCGRCGGSKEIVAS